MTYHDFTEKLNEGLEAEDAVEDWLRGRFPDATDITRVPIDVQKFMGDIWVWHGDSHISFEIKVDTAAERTGNAFIEYVSVDRTGAPGWALTSMADRILYIVGGKMYSFSPDEVRRKLPFWFRRFRSAKAVNKDYVGWGLLVPLVELRELCVSVLDSPLTTA